MLIVCGLKTGWRRPNTIGLDSTAEYSLSRSHTHTHQKTANQQTFSQRLQVLLLIMESHLTFFLLLLSLKLQLSAAALRDGGDKELLVFLSLLFFFFFLFQLCSDSASIVLSSLSHKTFGRCCSSGEQKDETRGDVLFIPRRENVCVITGRE